MTSHSLILMHTFITDQLSITIELLCNNSLQHCKPHVLWRRRSSASFPPWRTIFCQRGCSALHLWTPESCGSILESFGRLPGPPEVPRLWCSCWCEFGDCYVISCDVASMCSIIIFGLCWRYLYLATDIRFGGIKFSLCSLCSFYIACI